MSRRDLNEPRNLVHAARKALGLDFTATEHFYGGNREESFMAYSSQERYPPELALRGRLSDGRHVRLLPSSALTPGRAPGRASKHRLQIRCVGCRQWIPIGRCSQHMGSRSCAVGQVEYEERVGAPRARSFLELRRLAYKARRNAGMREVLHDALLETFPKVYGMFVRRAQRRADTSLGRRYSYAVLFRPRYLRDYKLTGPAILFHTLQGDTIYDEYRGRPGAVGPSDVVVFQARPRARRKRQRRK